MRTGAETYAPGHCAQEVELIGKGGRAAPVMKAENLGPIVQQ